MACQGFPPFIGTKYSNFLNFQLKHGHSVIYEKDSLNYLYGYLETSKAPTTLIPKTSSTSNNSPYIAIYDFPTLAPTQPPQDASTSPSNATYVSWATFFQQQFNMDPNIAALTRKYCNACKQTGYISDNCCKYGLTFLPPQINHKLHHYNLNHGSTPKLPPTTSEGDETITPYAQQDLHPDINTLAALANTSTTMTPSISANTFPPSYLVPYNPLPRP